MDPHLEERLTKIEQKLEAIQTVVVKTRKAQKTASTIRALYWVFIILLGFGAFYFIQPVFNQLKDAYGFGNTSETQNFKELMNQVKGLQTQ